MRSHFSHEISFIGHRKQFLTLSCILVILSIVGLAVRGLVFGIEFTGGTEIDFYQTGDITIEQMRDALAATDEGTATVQTTTTQGEAGFLVRSDTTDPTTANAHAQAAAESLGLTSDNYTVTTIGPDWGADTTRSSLMAFGVAILLIIAYVSFRYEFKMSITAVIALIHDLVITLGVYAWFQIDISPNVIAALLTIMGYSLYDTVVEFNRMNENAKQLRDGVHHTYFEICNFSINEVIVRTINTTIVTLVPVVCMLAIGGATLKDFASPSWSARSGHLLQLRRGVLLLAIGRRASPSGQSSRQSTAAPPRPRRPPPTAPKRTSPRKANVPGLLDSRRWDVLDADPRAEASLARALGVPPLVARVLVARGFASAEEARAFLTPSLERDWADPLLIPGMAEAADRVERAVRAGEDIAVFGDFDVDGMSSTCILALGLRELGCRARAYIPHRFGEGYGLTKAALDRVLADGKPDLLVTVDNGIAAQHEVDWLREQGIDVVVTDHHEPADLVPQGVPVTDPKLAAEGPLATLRVRAWRSSSWLRWDSAWGGRMSGAPTPTLLPWAPSRT